MSTLSDRHMQALTRPLRTKAEKIRALGRAGVSAGDIGRFLDIRYQHAYNVLKRAGIAINGNGSRQPESATSTAPAKTVLDESGRVQIPAHILEAWDASAGEELLVRLEGDEIHILTRRAGVRLAQDILRRYVSTDDSLADELIAERRREAEAEDA